MERDRRAPRGPLDGQHRPRSAPDQRSLVGRERIDHGAEQAGLVESLLPPRLPTWPEHPAATSPCALRGVIGHTLAAIVWREVDVGGPDEEVVRQLAELLRDDVYPDMLRPAAQELGELLGEVTSAGHILTVPFYALGLMGKRI